MCVHGTLSQWTSVGRGKTQPMKFKPIFFPTPNRACGPIRLKEASMTVQVKQLFGEESLGIIPGDWNDPVIDCHEACSSDFDRCWDGCDSDDEDCHNRCVAESDVCDALCGNDGEDDLDPWDREEEEEDRADWYVDYETCSRECDRAFDACFEACDGKEACEEQCEDLAVECDTACIEAEDNWEEWSQED